MIKNPKAKGSRNELRTKTLFEDAGGKLTKAGGSLGVFDLVGHWHKNPLYIQCKTNSRIPRKERVILDDELRNCPETSLVLEWVWYDRKGWRAWYAEILDNKTIEWVPWAVESNSRRDHPYTRNGLPSTVLHRSNWK